MDSLVATAEETDDLRITAAKGLEFYDKLENNVHKLLLRVRGLVAVQQKQRDSQIAAYAPAAPTLASDLPPGFLEAPPSISGVENPAEDFEAAMAFHDQLQDEAPIPAQLATPTHQLASEIDPNFGTKEAIFSPEKQMSISSTTDPADQTALSQLQNRNGITLPSTFEDFDDDDEVMVMGPGMTFPVMASQVKPATKPEVAPEEQQVVKKDPPGPSESVSAPPSDKDVDEANKIAAESFTPVTSNEARLKENDDAKETVSELSEDNSLVQEASDSFKSPAHTTATAPPPGTPSSELPGGVSFYPGPSSMPSSSSYNPNPNPYMSQTAPYNPGHVAPPLAPTSYGVRPVPAVPASMPYPAVSTPYNPAMSTAMSQPYYGYQPTGQPLPNNQFHQQQYALPSNSFQYYQQPSAVTSSHPPPLKPEKLTLKAVLAQRKANKLPLPQDERKMSGGGSGYSSVEASPQHIPKSSGAAPVSSTPLPAPRVSTPPHLTMTTPAVQQPTLVGSDGHFHGHGSGQPAGQLPQAGPPRMSTQMQQPVVSQSPDKSQKEDDEDEGWTESKLIPVPRQRRDSDPVYVLSDEPSFPSQGSDESYGDYDPVRMYAEYAAIASKIPGNPIYQDEFRYQAKPHPASKNPTDAGAASPIPKSPAKPADNNQVEPPSVPSAQHQVHSTPVPQSPVPSQASGQPPQRHGTSMTPPNSFGHLNQAVPPTGSAGHQIPGPAGTHHVFPSPSKRVHSPSHALAPQSQVNPGYQQAVHLHHQSPRGPYPSGGNPSYLTQQANYSIRSANAQSAHVIPHSPQQQAPRHSAPTFQNPASHATSGYFPPQQVASQQVAPHQFASHQMAPQQVAHHQGASQTVPSLYQQQLTSVAYGFPTQHQPQAGHSSSTHTQYPTSSLTTPPNLSSQSSAYSAPAVRSLQTSTAAQGASPYPFQMQHGPAGGYNAASPTISHAYKVPVQQQQQLQQQQQQIQQPQQQPQQQQQQQHPTFTPAVSAGLQQQPHTPAPFYPSRSVVVNQNVGGVQWHQGQGQVHGQGQAAATYPPSSSAAALPLPPISSATMLGKSLLPPGQTQPVPSPPQDPLASRGINPSYAGSSSVGTMLPQQQAGAYPGSPNHARAPYPPRSTTVQPQVHHNPAPSPLRPQQQPNYGQTPSPSQYSAFPTIATSASYSMPEAATFPRQQPAPQAQQRQQQQPIHNAPSGQPVQHVSTHSADPSRNPVQTAGPLVGYKPVVPQPGGGGVLAGYYPDSLQPVVAQPGTTMVPGPSQMTAGVRPKEIGTTASQQATGAGGGYMLRPEAVPPGAPQGNNLKSLISIFQPANPPGGHLGWRFRVM